MAVLQWFGRLENAKKDTYEHLMEVFKKEWPLIATVKESKAKHI